MRNELQNRSEDCPEESPGNPDNEKANGPKNHHSERIQQLTEKPMLYRASAQPKMIAEVHASEMQRRLPVIYCQMDVNLPRGRSSIVTGEGL